MVQILQMRNSFLIIACFVSVVCFGQIGTGEWRMHIAASRATDVEVGQQVAVGLLETGLIWYDIPENESKIMNNLNGLSDIQTSCISYDTNSQHFFVGYKNGNIDLINTSGNVYNVPGVLLSNIIGSKMIYDFVPNGNRVYAASSIGIVVLNPSKYEISDTYKPGNGAEHIIDIEFLNDTIYALTSTKCYKAAKNNPFLSDPNQWQQESMFPSLTNMEYKNVAKLNNQLHVLITQPDFGKDSVFRVTSSGLEMVIGDDYDMEIEKLELCGNYFAVRVFGAVIVYDAFGNVVLSQANFGNVAGQPTAIATYDSYYFISDMLNGLVKYFDAYNYVFISKEGPPKNEFFSVNSFEDKIVVTGGIVDRVAFEYSSAGVYAFNDETWKLYDPFNQNKWQGGVIWDMGSAAIDPLDKEKMAVGSYSFSPLSIITGDSVTKVYNPSNSLLESSTLGNGFSCVSHVEYDDKGNLWVANGYANKPLKVLSADGVWTAFETGSAAKTRFTTKLAVDYNGNVWMGVYDAGLIGYSINGTLENTADDQYKLFANGEGSGNLPSNNVTAIAVDFDNEIWVGTDNGFAVLYNSESAITSSSMTDASTILINFEGNVEEFLGGTPITDIEIDGGNRKWIATSSTGLFLISADGQEVIAQYNKDNSPLISNNIMDIDFNHKTGELFIVTDLGLVSLRTDATYEDPTYASTKVFPNPVRPDYFGPITIQGIRYNSDVKVTDAAGNLVYKTTSNGGTATWNGKTLSGENVASGVYIFWTATNEGKDEKVGKVAIIR